MKAIAKRLLVISFDGLSGRDIDVVKDGPGFSRLISQGSYSTEITSVFPSVTYPAHTTVVTGFMPKNHGITDNTLLQPGEKEPDWHWYWRDILQKTIYEYVREKGLKTAALLWPVSAGAPIDYNMPEIWANRSWRNQGVLSLLHGSKRYQLQLLKKYGKLLDGIHQPNLDNFVHQSLLDTLREKDTQLTMAHYTDLDSMRHAHGFSSKEAIEALHRHDQRLLEIFKTLEEIGKLEETVIWIFGDHSSKDIDRIIALNPLFMHHGLIRQDKKSKKIHWEAWAKAVDGACYVYAKSDEAKEKVRELLKRVDEKGVFDNIYSAQEASAKGADPNCAFMLDGAEGYGFSDTLKGPVICSAANASLKYKGKTLKNVHGYNPNKREYKAFLGAVGPGIRKANQIGAASLLDEGPTMMRILGMDLYGAQGRILEEMFEDEEFRG